MALNTTEIIDAVRTQIDESSEVDITDAHILSAANRAMTSGMDILVRTFPDPMITFTDMTTTEVGKVDLPIGIFEDLVVHVDLLRDALPYRLEPVSFEDIYNHEFATQTNTPDVFAVFGRELHLRPNSAIGTKVRVWHVRTLEKLVKPQGRITRIGADYVVVDSYGNGLSTDSDEMNSFFNVIGFSSGKVKWTGQVKTISGDKITHKTTASRSQILTHDVSTDFADASPVVRTDDYICSAEGTCIPYMPQPLENYVVHASVIEMKNRLGYDTMPDRGLMGTYEKQLKNQWQGRPNKTKVHMLTRTWDRRFRR